MKLHQLFLNYPYQRKLINSPDDFSQTEISGLFFDARQVKKDSVFFAIKGSANDGHQFIPAAVDNGAIVLMVENTESIPKNFRGLVFQVESTREALDQLAARFYDFPSEKLFCIGVTGTNGKTSITYILEHILNANQKLTGVMGTVNHRVGDQVWESQMTTPDPVTLQSRLNDFVQQNAFAAAMEVSSHALDQNRADSVHFNTVIFTNLTLDHLDYHQTMDHYFASKQKLFTDLMWSSKKFPLFAIVNVDDKYGRRLKTAEPVVTWTYGQSESDFQFKIKSMNFQKTVFDLQTPMETKEFTISIPGVHTVYNIVACILAALTCGISLDQSAKALLDFKGIPGRLQKVDSPDSKLGTNSSSEKYVFVDYAHTPDALLNTLQSIRKIQAEGQFKGRLICVFGCGGDRDKSKRPQMAQIACQHSDFVVITSDNPRTESPEEIIKDIQTGIPAGYSSIQVEVDRDKAIGLAIANAQPQDVILIAGKGHEDYQIIGEVKKHFSDLEVARKYLWNQ